MNQITLSLALSCMALLALTTSCKKDAGPTDISNQFTVSTIAGNGIKGSVDGPASSSQFYSPTNIVADAQGNVYVSDNSKHSIRRISKDGTVNTLAGGTKGTADGKGASAQFISVGPLALDAQNNVYVVDSMRIRKITPAGDVTSLTGALDGGYVNSAGIPNDVPGIAVDKLGSIYAVVKLALSSRILKIEPSGQVTTFIDTTQIYPTPGYISTLHDIVIDAAGNILVTRNVFLGYEIDKISPSKMVSLLASTPDITGIAINPSTSEVFFSGTVLECASLSSCKTLYQVYKLNSDGKYVAIAGADRGFADGPGNSARFDVTGGISADAAGNLYVADRENNRIRKISKL